MAPASVAAPASAELTSALLAWPVVTATGHQVPACAADTGSLCQRLWDGLGIAWLAQNADAIVWHGLRIILIIVIAVVVRALAVRAIRRFTRVTPDGSLPPLLRTLRERAAVGLLGPIAVARRRQRSAAISSVLRSATNVIIVTIALILVLSELGIDIAPILASAGIVGVAIGFGAQNLVKDFLSGIFMMLEDQYGVGDRVDLGPASGTVMEIRLRVTTLRGDDGQLWYVRNGEITRVGNSSQPPIGPDGRPMPVAAVPEPDGSSPDGGDPAEPAAGDEGGPESGPAGRRGE